MFRPNFIEPENMIILGFELVKDKDNYMTYHNNATDGMPTYQLIEKNSSFSFLRVIYVSSRVI